MQFRYDINALRAIAVVSVLLFHFFPSLMPAGFAGVDVFFVISGYLMTRIIDQRLQQRNWSFWAFYKARAQRIFPALAAVCLAILVFSWFANFHLDAGYVINKHIAASLAFISNIIYWQEVGYFDAIATEKWLLHTWSLSVEWQFYLLYPLVLVGLRKALSRNSLKIIMLVLTVLAASFGWWLTVYSPNLAYYVLLSRGSALLLGGLAYFFPLTALLPQANDDKRSLTIITITSALGYCAIFASFYLFDHHTPWPSSAVLLPTLGAFLVISSQQDSYSVLRTYWIQSLGRWSYSIYLWHWPLMVFAGYLGFRDSELSLELAGFALLSIIIGAASYRYVEPQRNFGVALWGVVLVITTALAWQNKQEILQQKQQFFVPSVKSAPLCAEFDPNVCQQYGEDHEITFILWGDSHSQNLRNYLAFSGYKFIAFTTLGCPPIAGVDRVDQSQSAALCRAGVNDQIFTRIQSIRQQQPALSHLLMIGRWNLYRYGWHKQGRLQTSSHFLCFRHQCDDKTVTPELFAAARSAAVLEAGLTATLEQLSEWQILLLHGEPQLPVRGIDYSGRKGQQLTLQAHQQAQSENNRFFQERQQNSHKLSCYDYSPALFPENKLIIQAENRLLFKDDNHLVEYGWQWLGDPFLQQIDRWLHK